MKQKLPTRRMREHPDLEQLKRQAKKLLNAFKAGDSAAVDEVNAHYDSAQAATFALHDAQLVIARSYGFDSWPKLKAYVDGVSIRRLVEAVRAGHVERVRAMLQARTELADMTVSYGDEHRAIHYAVMHRRPEIARLLMQKGANARAGIHPHRDATSAWTLARERGYEEIVAIIEEEEERRAKPVPPRATGPAPEPKDEVERVAVANGDLSWLRVRLAEGKLTNHVRWDDGGVLTVAVRNNRIDALEFLLECGFDPDERVSSGEGDWIAYSQGYPLWYSAALARSDMAKLLLDRGANPNVHVDSSGSAVYSAYSHKQWQLVELLRERGGIVTGDIAAIYRQTDLARQMLIEDERGVLPHSIKPSDRPLAEELLRFGAEGGATEIVRMALERIDWARHDARWFGMLVSPLSFWHHIPWLYAGNKDFDRESYLECFRLILNACDVNVVGGFGRTILHEIAAMGEWITEAEVAAFGRAALEAGARMDRRDEILSSTPLGWACRWGRVRLVRLLIEHGADPEENGAEAWARPRSWALKMGHHDVVQALT
ncbi:MAG: ankyrin repeat domain-containing protein [Acidobacteriaceae bacterium]|nr:ankyrin repeat domain-containing protein [Acidobacteriaceae bacterium]